MFAMKDKRAILEAKRAPLIISCTLIHGIMRKNEQKKNINSDVSLFRSILEVTGYITNKNKEETAKYKDS
jgi:hypothetical protein